MTLDKETLSAEAQSLASSIRSNVLFAHGQMAVVVGAAVGSVGTLFSIVGSETPWWGVPVFLFLIAVVVFVVLDTARVRATTARLAGVRRAVELALDQTLNAEGKKAGHVWEQVHQGDYDLETGWKALKSKVDQLRPPDPRPDTSTEDESEAKSPSLRLWDRWVVPRTLASGIALNRADRSAHYLVAFYDTSVILNTVGSDDANPFDLGGG